MNNINLHKRGKGIYFKSERERQSKPEKNVQGQQELKKEEEIRSEKLRAERLEKERAKLREGKGSNIREFLSAALATRITDEIGRFVIGSDSKIYVSEKDETTHLTKEKILDSYGPDLLSPDDYQKIRNAFLVEIKKNPKKWELVRSDREITGLKERDKSRIHGWQGFKFAKTEEREIRELIEEAEKIRLEKEKQQRVIFFLLLILIIFFSFFVFYFFTRKKELANKKRFIKK